MKKINYIYVVICAAVILIESVLLICFISENAAARTQINNIFSVRKVVQISNDPLVYICERDNAVDIFKEYMRANSWNFISEGNVSGTGFLFEKDGTIHCFALTYESYAAKWTLIS